MDASVGGRSIQEFGVIVDGREFWQRIESDPELHNAGILEADSPEDDAIDIVYTPPDAPRCRLRWRVSISSILHSNWTILREVFAGKRDPRILKRISRIVGYYGYLHNWNRSKLAELRDRHKGSYALPESGGIRKAG